MKIRSRHLVLAGAILAAVTGRPLPGATADVPAGIPPSVVEINSFRAGSLEIGGWASASYYPGRGFVCVAATRSTIRRDTKTVVTESTCGVGRVDGAYYFDPVTWVASARGTLPAQLASEVYRRSYGEWRWVSGTYRSSRAAVIDLKWTGRGDLRPGYGYWLPGICYWPPGCLGGAGVSFSRDATVMGTLRFNGLRARVTLPGSHSGVMNWYAVA